MFKSLFGSDTQVWLIGEHFLRTCMLKLFENENTYLHQINAFRAQGWNCSSKQISTPLWEDWLPVWKRCNSSPHFFVWCSKSLENLVEHINLRVCRKESSTITQFCENATNTPNINWGGISSGSQ